MLDSVIWKVFEKTGNIDAYLLYSDIKSTRNIKVSDIKTCIDDVDVQLN
jgi:hypothetical protein